MTEEEVRQIVKQTVEELFKCGALRAFDDLAYTEAASLLAAYYQDGERDEAIRAAIESVAGDRYAKIIPLTYSYGYTLNEIAELMDVDVSTVSRNKRRLIVEIYRRI